MYHKLFPTLIAEYNLNDKVDNKEIVRKMRMSGLQFHGILQKGQSSYLGGYDCALTRLAMTDLKDAIQDCVNEYCRNAGLQENIIVNSWCNILNEGGYVRRHRHEKSILSGAYYPTSDADDTPLFLENPNTVFKMTETKEFDTEFNWEKAGFTVETGKLLLWPSHLYHLTERNRSKERFTISFNTLDRSYLDALNRLTH